MILELLPLRVAWPAGGAAIVGRLVEAETLANAQDCDLEAFTKILLVNNIGGDEDIPAVCLSNLLAISFHCPSCTTVLLQNVAAVISEQAPDVLSHAAVRARNMGVLLAACHDAAILADLRSHAGSRLTMQLAQVC